jgi:hypothetical protein
MVEADSDVHSSDNGDTPQNNHNTDSDKDDITGTNNMQWTDSTHYQPSVPVVYKSAVNPSC